MSEICLPRDRSAISSGATTTKERRYAYESLIRNEVLSEIFEATVKLHPQTRAIEFEGLSLTYEQLNERANRFAHYLIQQGITRGDTVGLWLNKSFEVFVAILGITKAGAVYVPMDPEYPKERVDFIVEDSAAKLLITTSEKKSLYEIFPCKVIAAETLNQLTNGLPVVNLDRGHIGLTPADICYIIYTSGSTGHPKGVEIEHRSVCHLIRAEGEIFKVTSTDRVYQGFSLAFDASIEEVWLAFHAGATLYVANDDLRRGGPDFAGTLTAAGITVLSWVPSMLATIHEDMPSLRLIIVGGEACNLGLVQRWATPTRRFVNTYGPTEATVIATYADCLPGHPITIGKPVFNYGAFVLDDKLKPVEVGEPGELCLSGIGLARGYVNRQDLTAKNFITAQNLPFLKGVDRIYRTGDLVRETPEGTYEFLGRIDTQIKLRGFRIELAEIESAILEYVIVENAAVIVREDDPDRRYLAAYITLKANSSFDLDAFKIFLRSRLPNYMVPAAIVVLEEFPTLSSGKIDRKNLPKPVGGTGSAAKVAAPQTQTEQELYQLWCKLFKLDRLSIDNHFFNDLGGDSMLAATMASMARTSKRFEALSIADIYHFPSIRKLCTELDQRAKNAGSETYSDTASKQQSTKLGGRRRSISYALCVIGQTLALYPILGIYGAQWVLPYFVFRWIIAFKLSFGVALASALFTVVAIYPLVMLFVIIAKWLIIGKFKPGRYPLWGSYYFRWWLVQRLIDCVPVDYFVGTPFLAAYFRMLGARIGKHVQLHTTEIFTFDLVTIGDNATISSGALLIGSSIVDGELLIGSISVGEHVRVGTCSVLGRNTRIDPHGELDDQSVLTENCRIASNERWMGSPAVLSHGPAYTVVDALPAQESSFIKKAALLFLDFLSLIVIPVLAFSVVLPGMIVILYLDEKYHHFWYLLGAPGIALSFIVIFTLMLAIIKWGLLGRVKAGTYRDNTLFYVNKSFVDRLMGLSLEVVGSLYSTIYLAPWYRLMGAKLGKGAEVSTISLATTDLIDIGDESFIADMVSFGATYYNNGCFTLAPTKIGKRSFIGNSAHIPPGYTIGSKTLIGVLSVPPIDRVSAKEADLSWLGSPAVFLPFRTAAKGFSEEETFKPTAKLKRQRAAIEFLRVIMPSTAFIVLSCLMLSYLNVGLFRHNFGGVLLRLPFIYAFFGICAALIVVAIKWLLIGKYHSGEKPLWSTFVWRTEFLTAMHENFADPFLVQLLVGTPYINWFFRLMGSKIGRRVYLDTTALTEFDLITVGDDACINLGSTLQTHLFEDRIMKMADVVIEDGATVGISSIVLYDTKIGKNAILGDLSLLMKGEQLPKETAWEGIPAQRAKSHP